MVRTLKICFWVWAVAGLLANTPGFLSVLGIHLAVGVPIYVLLYWIGGMVLLGGAAAFTRRGGTSDRALDRTVRRGRDTDAT